jgi:FkbM family methyltransferase
MSNSKVPKFYEKTGMYMDWAQISRLPEIDTLIDIGVGVKGTPELYSRFPTQNLLLFDPLFEAEEYARRELVNRQFRFFQIGLGSKETSLVLNTEKNLDRSSLLRTTEINAEEYVEPRVVEIKTLDSIIEKVADELRLGKIGIKIDTEGFELEVIRGAERTLSQTEFVILEARHNHDSFEGQYSLRELSLQMNQVGFVLSMVLSAKPFICDLCFVPVTGMGSRA